MTGLFIKLDLKTTGSFVSVVTHMVSQVIGNTIKQDLSRNK